MTTVNQIRNAKRQYVKIEATAGTTAIVAAQGATKAIVLLHYVLVADGADECTWKSGATAISGAMEVLADSPLESGFEDGVMVCGANAALNLTTAGNVNGHCTYIVVDV